MEIFGSGEQNCWADQTEKTEIKPKNPMTEMGRSYGKEHHFFGAAT
jgi:hypothetical protein